MDLLNGKTCLSSWDTDTFSWNRSFLHDFCRMKGCVFCLLCMNIYILQFGPFFHYHIWIYIAFLYIVSKVVLRPRQASGFITAYVAGDYVIPAQRSLHQKCFSGYLCLPSGPAESSVKSVFSPSAFAVVTAVNKTSKSFGGARRSRDLRKVNLLVQTQEVAQKAGTVVGEVVQI